MSAKARIREIAAELGIDGIGFCDAEPLSEAGEALDAAIAWGFIPPEIAPRRQAIARLTTPTHHLRGARSVISAFESYYTGEPSPIDPMHGAIAYYTRSNYYEDLRLRLARLAELMQGEFGCRTKAFSCYVTLAEKPLASRAGTGFYGKHGIIITPSHGSYVVLGEILTDLDIEPDAPLDASCGTCNLCVEACPTGALAAPYVVDRRRCIQYLGERPCTVPAGIREVWNNRLYGCTTCQDVCPRNARLTPVGRNVAVGRVGPSVPLADVLSMDDAEFQARFCDNQIGRRDRNAIRRNAVIAAGNSRSEALIPLLRKCAADPDPMIRLHSMWAISRIRGRAAAPEFREALTAEKDAEVRGEIKTQLDGFGEAE